MKQIQDDIRLFMTTAGQDCPMHPTIPTLETRILHAKIIIEEAFEQAKAMGVHVSLNGSALPLEPDELTLQDGGQCDLVEIADGIADQVYVSVGAACAFGINMEQIWELVQRANMAKFGPGSFKRPDGKQMKPPGWTSPNDSIKTELLRQCNEGNE